MGAGIWATPGKARGAKGGALGPGWRWREGLVGDRALALGTDTGRGGGTRPSDTGRRQQAAMPWSQADTGRTLVHWLSPSYGMRYVAKVLKTALAEKFPGAPENEVYKASAPSRPPSSPSPRGCL